MEVLGTELRGLEDERLGKKPNLGARGKKFKTKGACPQCQKVHLGRPCNTGGQGCYTCGETGHMARDYPKGPVCFNC